MKNFINKLLVNHSLIYKLFLYIVTIILVVYLFPKGGQFKYEFQKGKPWQYENYYAPFDFAIKKTTEEIDKETNQIKDNSKQFFKYDDGIAINVKSTVLDKIAQLLSNSMLSENAKTDLNQKALEIIDNIYEYGYLETSNIQSIENKIITLRRGNKIEDIHPNKLFKSSQILAAINSVMGFQPYTQEESNIMNIIYEELKPNVSYDKNFTDKVLQENLSKISYTKGLISEKERIIFKGDIVEGENLMKLNSIKSEFESQVWSKSNYNWIVFGYTILVALSFLMLLLFLRKYRMEIFENNNKVTFIFFNIILIVLLITLIAKFDVKYIYVAPIVILPLVLKAFFDARLGLFTHVLTVLLLGFIVPNSFEFIFLQIIAGIVTILTISELYKRANLFISVLQITFVYFLAYFAFSIIQEGNAQNLDWDKFLYFSLNGAATLFVLPLIYIFEKLFGLISDESLKELSNTNSKLLRELAEKAPGTFQHSLQVANLAEACANEIQANSMLVRTGALYHDIGKMDNPMFFTENQSTNVNPHNELTPRDSAQIIIDHIIKGVEMAKKNHLPDRIIDFIRTHHGTTLVYYFYKKEEELLGANIKTEDFQYPGPIPFSKETAILMMCDSVEAASKSVKDPSALAFDNLVEKIVNKQMEDRQFMNADITFKELQTIKKVLKKKLKNIYHVRIEYPE
ncbi:MAG: HDIG domain-containing protein [Lutibacter sp.]|uniref:HD family phosphohydrolase n=1 Tax=Lutibacter sp. TaxID=1925666 RepID=UPI0017A195A0|nr:HDIG domain-containing metalloprotein [Lutibacter sp.]MBT8317105.1 HDIG domain-containing protein [Lutibacter sp.]NNJ57965.1 HDIG domain-containing protein [Lutibacter sp.]